MGLFKKKPGAKGQAGVALIYVIASIVCGVLAVFAAEKMVVNIGI